MVNGQGPQGSFRALKLLCMIQVIICLSEPAIVTNVLLWCRVLMGESVHLWGQGVYGNSVLSARGCWEPKTALKIIFERKKMPITHGFKEKVSIMMGEINDTKVNQMDSWS